MDNMLPYELEIYSQMMMEHIKEQNDNIKQT